ncbi:MAG: ethanolamine ammonia lyase large subunit, partial [Proteobacteria bacterium]|nr:ethanolamine ammonia lyase large subunit [Pseudomonadota bacterium]
VPGADDIMLNYQSTSFHDAQYVRQALKLRAAPEFDAWLQQMGVHDKSGRLLPAGKSKSRLLTAATKLLPGGGIQ